MSAVCVCVCVFTCVYAAFEIRVFVKLAPELTGHAKVLKNIGK